MTCTSAVLQASRQRLSLCALPHRAMPKGPLALAVYCSLGQWPWPTVVGLSPANLAAASGQQGIVCVWLYCERPLATQTAQ
jgi:hypothetical protein